MATWQVASRRVAPVSIGFQVEGAPGPSPSGTGEGAIYTPLRGYGLDGNLYTSGLRRGATVFCPLRGLRSPRASAGARAARRASSDTRLQG